MIRRLVMLPNRSWGWLDERLHLNTVVRATMTEYLVPARLTLWHTLGSILLTCFAVQVVTGMLLLVYYVPDTSRAFESVRYINEQVPYGWLVRRIHAMASHIFVLVLILHLVSVLYMRTYRKPREPQWVTGMALLGLVFLAALSGYLLPWSQLSYWATTVATNSAGAIPFVGHDMVLWLRGTPKVSQATLGRFFAMHVSIVPFAILSVVGIHLLFLRLTGIAVPGGGDKAKAPKVPFFPNMVVKDIFAVFMFLAFLNVLIFYFPQLNFPEDAMKAANPLETPAHVKPHWYFLANYQFLKIVPNEFLGVMLQGLVGVVLLLLPWLDRSKSDETGKPGARRLFPLFVTLCLAAYVGLAIWGYYS